MLEYVASLINILSVTLVKNNGATNFFFQLINFQSKLGLKNRSFDDQFDRSFKITFGKFEESWRNLFLKHCTKIQK